MLEFKTELDLQFNREFIKQTLIFEKEYPRPLRWTVQSRISCMNYGGQFLWMFEKGKLIGETFWNPLSTLWPEEISDGLDRLKDFDIIKHNSCYINSTTILKPFQGHGYGRLIKAYSLGLMSGRGIRRVFGHARNGASTKLSQGFGARIIDSFDNWAGTGETYNFYVIEL